MIFRFLFLLLMFVSLVVKPGHAEAPDPILVHDIDGIEFSVVNVDRATRQQKRYHMQTDWVKKETAPEGTAVEYIAITYQLANNNPTKKINMDSSFQFHLLDEFENQYRKMAKPDSYEEPILFADKHFPSIYPNENFKETIFFEAPIDTATRLTLLIKANPLGEGKIAKLILPVREQSSPESEITIHSDDVPSSDAAVPVIANNEPRWVRIIYPSTGHLINRGEATQIHVETSGNPTNIIVATMGTSFYDAHPQRKNVYDVRVPFGYYTGALSVNVIAEWDGVDKSDPYVVSDSIFLDVKSPYRPLYGEDTPIFEYFN